MTYVGFHPDLDPKKLSVRLFARKARKRPVETMTDYSMKWRIMHPQAEMQAHGRVLIPSLENRADEFPDRVVAYGATTRNPLVVFYREGS